MNQQRSKGGNSGGVEIQIRANAENALARLKDIQKSLIAVGEASQKSAAVAKDNLAALGASLGRVAVSAVLSAKSFQSFVSKGAISSFTATAKAVGAVGSAIDGIHRMSRLPIVRTQLEEIYKEAIKATQEVAPLSSVLKEVGAAAGILGKNFFEKGFLGEITSLFRRPPTEKPVPSKEKGDESTRGEGSTEGGPNRFQRFNRGILSGVQSVSDGVTSSIQKATQDISDKVAGFIAQTRTNITSGISKINEGVVTAFKERAITLGKDFREGYGLVAAKISQSASQAGQLLSPERIKGLAQGLPGAIKKQIESFSSDFPKQAEKGLSVVREQSRRALSLVRSTESRLSGAISEIGKRLPRGIRDTFSRLAKEAQSGLGRFSGVFEIFPKQLAPLIAKVSTQVQSIGGRLLETAKEQLGGLGALASGGIGRGAQLLQDAQKTVAGLSRRAADSLPEGVKNGLSALRDRISGVVQEFPKILGEVSKRASEGLVSLKDSVPQIIKERFLSIKNAVAEGLKSLVLFLRSGSDQLFKAFQSLSGGISERIGNGLERARTAITPQVERAKELILGADPDPSQKALPPAREADQSPSNPPLPPKPKPKVTDLLNPRIDPKEIERSFAEFKEKAFQVLDSVDARVLGTLKILSKVPDGAQKGFDAAAAIPAYLSKASEPLKIFEGMKSIVGNVSNKISEATQQIFFFTSAFDSLRSLVTNGPYQMLVGQNVELRKQLLQTQASLVSTNKILRDGQEIADPASAIQALDAPVQSAIAKIRRDSLELVGVTSKDLVAVFNIINQGASQANISLKQSADLTSSFAAALGTIGLPLFQARQEIGSILRAQIDQNSVLAKTLGLDNQRIRQLSQQGKLYDFLTEKLKAFRAGNALAAKTIEGVGSNIQEIFDNIALEAGGQLIDPIVEQLNRFYSALLENKSFLADYLSGLVASLLQVGLSLAKIVETFSENTGAFLAQIPVYLFDQLAGGATAFADAVSIAFAVLKPFIDLITMVAQSAIPTLASPLFKLAIILKVVGAGVVGVSQVVKTLSQLVPGLSQALTLITIRSAPLFQQLVNLKEGTGSLRVAMGLLAAKELKSIPGAMNAITNKLGIFGGMIAPLIPQVSQFAIAMIGLNKQFGITKNLPVAGIFKEISGAISGGLLPSLAQVARSKGLAQLADQVDGLAAKTAAVASPAALIDAVSGKVGNALGIDTTTKKVSVLQVAVNNVSTTIGSKLLPAFSSVAKFAGFKKIANQADALAESVLNSVKKGAEMSKFDQVVDGVTQNIGKSVAKSTMMIVGWTAAISAAVIVIVELWKRSEDAGDQVRKLSTEMSATAELIRTTWDQTKKNVDQSLIKEENIIPPKDWIDSAILGIREIETTFYDAAAAINKNPFDFEASTKSFKELFAEVKTFKDFSLIVVKSIGALITLIGRLSTAFGEAVFGIGKGFMTLLIGLSKALTTFFKNPLDTKALGDAFNELGESIKGVFSDTLKNIGDNFQKIETKGEKSFREIGEALRSGELDKAIADVGGSLEQMQKQIDSVKGGSGALFSQALAPVDAAIERLKNGTGTVKEVKDAIASVGQSFPELQKDLQGLSTQLGVEFPGEVITASKSIQGLEESLGKMKTDGKAVGGIQEVVENFKAGKATISDVLGEIDKYRNSLDENNFEGRKEAAGLAAPIDALQKSLDSLDAGASNRKLADIRASVDKDIEATDKLLKDREAQGRLGLTDAETSRLRERKAKLEAYRDQLEAIAEAVKAQAGPFSKMESELNNAKTQIEKAMGDIANAQKESIAKIRVTQNANLDMDTGKERILSDSQARIEILKQETAAIQKEIPARYEALQKLLKLWNEMTPEEQESTRGKDLKRQMDAEQAALYEASANGAEKRAELEKAIAEKSISDIDRANKVALEKAQQAESERLVMLTQMRSQGLITAEEFEKQKADASVATAKKELEEQQKVLKSLEELPKPNDPDEAREREERIRAEKLKTSQATLKLIEAENAAYEAQTRKILAEIERRNDIIRAGLERRGRSGEITDSEKAEKEAALELKRLRAELAREKDANKRAELQLQLEKAKTSLQNTRRQKEQEEFDRKLSEAEAAQLQAQREGGIDAEKAYTAVLERRLAAARRAVAIAKDANEKAKAQLELQQVLNDLEVDRIDRNLKAIENSYKRQNNSLQTQVKLFELAERSLANQKELIDAGNQLRASIGEYYDQTLGALSSLEKSDYRRRQLAEVTATIKLQAAIQEVKIAEQTLAIEQQMKRLALEREKIQARIAENEKLGNIKRLEAEEKKARIKGVSPEELEAIRIERRAAEEDYQLAQQSTALIDQQVAAQEDIFLIQQKIQQMQSKGKVEGAAANLIQNMADPGNQFNASEAFKEYLSQQLGAGSYSQLREGGLQSARNFQDQFFGQGFSRAGLQRDFFDIGKSLRDSQNQSFIATLPGASQRAIRPTTETRFGDSWSAASSPEARDLAAKYYSPSEMDKPQVPQIAPAGDLGEITGYVRGIFERMTTSEAARPSKGGVEVTIQSLTVSGNISSSGSVDSGFSTNFRRELEKVFNEAARQSLV